MGCVMMSERELNRVEVLAPCVSAVEAGLLH
jgi:hypothetical protein